MRRSVRSKTKSLKAELEDSAQSKYKMLKVLHRRKSESESASIRTESEVRDDGESFMAGARDEEELQEECKEESGEEWEVGKQKTKRRGVGENQGRNRRGNDPEKCENPGDSDRDQTELQAGPEEEYGVGEEEEGVGELSGEGRWRHYPTLCATLPGRERQIQLLLTLLGEPHSAGSPSLHIYGHTSTGKTLTLKTILTVLEVPHAFINCVECYSSKLLYKTILSQLSGASSSSSDSSSPRCDSMPLFIHLLRKHADERGLTNTTIYIVLDKAERLREMEPTLLPALLRLSELTHRQVCTILVSELVWEKFYVDTGALPPYPLHFPQYTKSEVLTIMCLDCPSDDSLSFYKTFANHIWNVFQCVCRDLGELRHLSSLLYPKYCEPVETGEIGKDETRKLWRHIEPYFRGVMSKIYLREISSVQWEKAQSQLPTEGCASASSLAQGVSQPRRGLELPYFSKYLLIASYLASYNPSKSDKKFFSKQKQARSRKSKKPFQLKEKPNYQLLGPKPFPLDRLMAIFYSIIEEPVAPSADVYSQITSLVTLQLICQLHTKDPLDGPKYKCLVTLEAVQQVARTVGFDLVHYLYDFN